jgi:hypothetical protein
LDAEYRFRWTKAESHKSYLVIQDLPVPELLPRIGVTKFVTAMPAACILDDPIASYRNYYIREKASLAKWTRTRVPAWFIEGLRKVNAGLIPNLSPSDDEVIVNTFSKLDKPVYDYVDPFADLDKSNEDFSYF